MIERMFDTGFSVPALRDENPDGENRRYLFAGIPVLGDIEKAVVDPIKDNTLGEYGLGMNDEAIMMTLAALGLGGAGYLGYGPMSGLFGGGAGAAGAGGVATGADWAAAMGAPGAWGGLSWLGSSIGSGLSSMFGGSMGPAWLMAGTSLLSSMFAHDAAQAMANAQNRAFQQDLDYKKWADAQNAKQKEWENQVGLVNLATGIMGNKTSTAMQGANLMAQYGAPGQAFKIPTFDTTTLGQVLSGLSANAPQFGTYNG